MKLLQDVKEDVTVAAGKSITLDLNGHKITNVSSHTITNSGTLTITDYSMTIGTIDNLTHAKASVENLQGATCTIEKAVIKRSNEAGSNPDNSGGNSWYYVENFGTMTIHAKDGINSNVTVGSEGHFSSLVHNGWYDGSDNKSGVEATMIINAGSFKGGLNTIKNDDYGNLTINDGTFENATQVAVFNVNKATINGGSFESTTESAVYTRAIDAVMDWGVTTVYGGTYKSADNYTSDFSMGPANGSYSAKVVVYGGTFSKNPAAYVAAGYSATQDSSKNYVVAPNTTDKKSDDSGNSGAVATSGVTVDNSAAMAEDAAKTAAAVEKAEFSEGNTSATIGDTTVSLDSDQAAALSNVVTKAKENGSKVEVDLVVVANEAEKTDETIAAKASAASSLVPFELSVDMVATVKDAKNNVTASANVPVTETKSAIKATIEVAKGDGEISRVAVARNHDGDVDMLPATFTNGSDNKVNVTFETNKFSDYAVALYYKGQYYQLSSYTEDNGTRKPINPEDFGYPKGEYAFAGWYKDADFKNAYEPNVKSGDAYPAFAKISDLIEFEGGSLRMDWTGESVYDMTSLRFGYEMKVPANATLDKDSWGWNVKNPSKPDAEPVFVKVENYWLADSNGAIANVVISPVHRTQYTEGSKTWYGTYATEYEVTAQVAYTTADGTKVTVSDQTRTRSVKDVATAIQNSSFASEKEKNYAKGILG